MIHALVGFISLAVLLITISFIGPILKHCWYHFRRYAWYYLQLAIHYPRSYYFAVKARLYPTEENRERAWRSRKHFVIRSINRYVAHMKTHGEVYLCPGCGFPRLKGTFKCEYCLHLDPVQKKELWDFLLKKTDHDALNERITNAVSSLKGIGFSTKDSEEIVARVLRGET